MSDSRSEQVAEAAHDIRPVVRKPNRGLSTGAIVGLTVVAGLILFLVLNQRRQALTSTAASAPTDRTPAIASPPPLTLPRFNYVPAAAVPAFPQPAPPSSAPRFAPAAPSPSPSYTRPSVQLDSYAPAPFVPAPPPPRIASGPALVIDSSVQQPGVEAPPEPSAEVEGGSGEAGASLGARARASMIANRAETVPQGTLIPAVLETAYDSTRPGLARALVQRDVRGFDGTRVLIPRGSRLIGEYGASVEAGQRRAMIIWSRLIRPDGVTISISSPATDRLGRGGVRASVDSHFFERFSGAILQSALDVGVNLAARAARSPVIVALPGSIGAGGQATRPAEIRPTLSIPAATTISVFVARDLDFSDVAHTR